MSANRTAAGLLTTLRGTTARGTRERLGPRPNLGVTGARTVQRHGNAPYYRWLSLGQAYLRSSQPHEHVPLRRATVPVPSVVLGGPRPRVAHVHVVQVVTVEDQLEWGRRRSCKLYTCAVLAIVCFRTGSQTALCIRQRPAFKASFALPCYLQRTHTGVADTCRTQRLDAGCCCPHQRPGYTARVRGVFQHSTCARADDRCQMPNAAIPPGAVAPTSGQGGQVLSVLSRSRQWYSAWMRW